MKIFIVDDEPLVRELIREVIATKLAGENTDFEFGSPDEAIAKLEEIVPDLLISDVDMPGEKTVYDLIREAVRVGIASMLVLSDRVDDEEVTRNLRLAAGDALMVTMPKPISTSKLAEAITLLGPVDD